MLPFELGPNGEVATSLSGTLLLDTPMFNKGTAFSESERHALGLDGLLPPHVTDLQEQCSRSWEELSFKPSDMERHIYLRGLQDRNEVLFYRLMLEHLEETMPLVYTPIVGWACRHFSHIYRRPRGLFIAYPDRAKILQTLRNRPYRDVDVIVVTDGERILGLGDQGAGGMGIPIGKLALYSLCGGIHPARTLPVILDCGTDNEERLHDPYYLGWRHRRVRGDDYFAFVDQFVEAVKTEFPHVLLQWEDFSRDNAAVLLDRYHDSLCTFNDDIQGTAAVTLAAVLSALRMTGGRLADLRVVLLGAGSAAVGIADLIVAAMVDEGVPEAQAVQAFWLLNSRGLVTDETTNINPFQRKYAKSRSELAGWSPPQGSAHNLAEVVENARPNVLVGVSGQAGMFGEAVVRSMARQCERPIVLPLSNPTSQSEAVPASVLDWTEGKAIVATGSPFPPVQVGERSVPIAQCNNSTIFPGLGLGTLASQARRVLPSMFLAAAREATACALEMGGPDAVLPPLGQIREVSRRIAVKVALEAVERGVAPEASQPELEASVSAHMWNPDYPHVVRG